MSVCVLQEESQPQYNPVNSSPVAEPKLVVIQQQRLKQ